MTVFDFDPTWVSDDDERILCASVDRESVWCIIISESLSAYEMICGNYKDYPGHIYCEWPETERERFYMRKKWCDSLKKFRTFEEYRDSNPMVEYYSIWDQGFYNLLNTDGTLDCAFQNERYFCYTHIGESKNFMHIGFGCVIDKMTKDIHYVMLGEDEGNYWGDHDITSDDLSGYEISLISAAVNDIPSQKFYNKESIIEKLFIIGRQKK